MNTQKDDTNWLTMPSALGPVEHPEADHLGKRTVSYWNLIFVCIGTIYLAKFGRSGYSEYMHGLRGQVILSLTAWFTEAGLLQEVLILV